MLIESGQLFIYFSLWISVRLFTLDFKVIHIVMNYENPLFSRLKPLFNKFTAPTMNTTNYL